MKKPSVTIFGEGRVGSTLKKSFIEAGYTIKSCFGSSSFPKRKEEIGTLLFLTVPDRKIQGLAQKICTQFQKLDGITVVHCSGTLSSEILKPFSEKKVNMGSFHPIKSVTHGQNSFEDVWFDIEGDALTITLLKQIAEDFNANSIELSAEAKPLLHAAAVVSSNYLVTLMHIAVQIAEVAKIDSKTALQVLLPLSESTLDNIKERGIETALTGPIARGDVETLKKHQSVLKEYKALLDIYNRLGELTLPLATEIESEDVKSSMRNLFKAKDDGA